jgi:hypothetical protein
LVLLKKKQSQQKAHENKIQNQEKIAVSFMQKIFVERNNEKDLRADLDRSTAQARNLILTRQRTRLDLDLRQTSRRRDVQIGKI